jgi:phosphoglycolate phosphatase
MGDVHRLIAFDLDGTIIDSRRDLADAANALIVELGGSPLTVEAIGKMVGEGAAVLVHRALSAAGIPEPPDAVARFLEIYEGHLLNFTRAYDGLVDVVADARRHARVVLLTNKPRRPSVEILEGLGLRELFDDVVGGDNSHGRKPEPAALHALMRDAGASPARTLLVGDSAIDHETARRAGVRCCLVSFGFGFENFPRERLTGDEWIAADAGELRGVIEAFVRG